MWVYCSRWTSANGGWMLPFILRRIELRPQFLRVSSVMAQYPGKISSFYNYFYSNSIDFFSFQLTGLYFRLTGCCSWRLPASCFLSRENKFLFIHLCYIAAFINRSSYKFCFHIVILVIKGEQMSLVLRTDLRIHAFVAFTSNTHFKLQNGAFKILSFNLSQYIFHL